MSDAHDDPDRAPDPDALAAGTGDAEAAAPDASSLAGNVAEKSPHATLLGGDDSDEVDSSANIAAEAPYDPFTLPDDLQVDDGALDAFTSVARELGLDQQQAQSLVDLEVQRLQSMAEQQSKAWSEQVNQWTGAVRNDAELGGPGFKTNLATARKALGHFGSPELVETLNQSGLGSHPEMVRLLYRIGKEMSEARPGTARFGATRRPKTHAEILYPDLP